VTHDYLGTIDPVVVKNVVAVHVPELEKAVRRMLSEENGDARTSD